MIKKIVTLAVGFVFAFVAIFFSVRAEGVADGKGSGKDSTVADPEEFGTVLETLPDSDYYEELMEEELLKKAGLTNKSLAAAADEDDDFRPVTVYEKTMMKRETSYSHDADSYHNRTESYSYLRRTMYIYYTKDAVYYDSVGKVVSNNKEERGPSDEYTRTTTEATTDFDIHLYIGKAGVFVKFNKWDTTMETVSGTVKKGTFTEDKKEEDDSEANFAQLAQEEVAKALKKNYGKWISVYGGELSETPGIGELPDGFDPDDYDPSNPGKFMEQYINLQIKAICAEVAKEYYRQLIETNANNSQTFAQFAKYLKAYDQPLAYEKSGDMYRMTDIAKQQLLADFGWADMSTGEYTRVPDTGNSYFVIDMNDKSAPAFLTNIDYNVGGSGGYSDYTLRDELGIKHLDNTAVPYTPDTKDDMYTLFGDAIKDILSKYMTSPTLLIDGLNGAWEVIG